MGHLIRGSEQVHLELEHEALKVYRDMGTQRVLIPVAELPDLLPGMVVAEYVARGEGREPLVRFEWRPAGPDDGISTSDTRPAGDRWLANFASAVEGEIVCTADRVQPYAVRVVASASADEAARSVAEMGGARFASFLGACAWVADRALMIERMRDELALLRREKERGW